MSRTATRLAPFGTTIFAEMTALALEHDAINLGQGFPDFEGPEALVETAVDALRGANNQYIRSMGHPELVSAIADHLAGRYDLAFDPMTEITVTCGATEGITASMLGLVEPGDEVVLFEPFYDSYPAAVAMAGATPRFCTLRFPDFALDEAALAACFGPRTKLLVLNDPHNPTGKVFDADELDLIARLCREHDVLVLADAVYEHLTFDDAHYVPMAGLPGMRERTLTLSSAGKTWSYTGWKVGWAYGPRDLVAAAQSAHQFLTFCTPAPMQLAVARAMREHVDPYLDELRVDYQDRRDYLVGALESAGFEVALPRGTYFALAAFGALFEGDDRAFAHYLAAEHGVACIPPSVFYQAEPEAGRQLARFAFCKRQSTLAAAAERLAGLAR
jgi:N-succinyldiaminopimelate aminotransferase